MAEYRKTGSCKALIVAGCLAQRYKEEITQEIEEVDAVLGTASYDEISLEPWRKALGGQQDPMIDGCGWLCRCRPRAAELTTGGHYAYLKIAEGCDKHCTYCIIPKVRGTYRSVPMEELPEGSGGPGGEGRQRADSGGPGDHRLRQRPVWRKRSFRSF